MSNFTSFPFVESLATIPLPKLPYLAVFFLINVPLLAISINVLRQLLIPRKPNEPPVVFHWIPIFGSAIEYGTDPINFFLRSREKYGDIFTFILFGRRMTVALGSKGSNFILGGRLAEVSAEEAYTALTTPVFGRGVVYDCPNHMLMEQKKFVKVGLSLDNFRSYVPMIVNEVEDFFKEEPAFSVFQKGDSTEWGTFPGYQKMAEITILTASRTLQGREVRASLDKDFAQRYHDLDGGFTPLNFLFPSLPLPSYRKRDIAQQAMSDFYVDIIKKRREEGRLEDGGDMIAALTVQEYKDGRPVTDREVAHMMTALLMAGQHTSSTTGAWALMNIAANPKVCGALYAEQVEHFGNPDGTLRPLTYDEVKQLPLMDSVVRETLRRHAPIHSIIRKVIQDMQVPPTLGAPKHESGTYVVPKGHFLLASPSVSQMDVRVWKDPDTWDPYRWLDDSGVAAQALASYDGATGEKIDYGFGAVSKGTESAYQPFGAGRHRCIGEQFAYLQIGTILSTFVRSFEMQMDKVPQANYQTLITQPLGPCLIKYRRRLAPANQPT